MSELKAWVCLLVAGGLGMLMISGYQIPLDPSCIGRCRLDTLARMQREFGSTELGGFMIFMGLAGFIWYSRRD